MSIDFKRRLAEYLSPILNVSPEKLYSLFKTPPSPDLGDFAIPCFAFTTEPMENPEEIAEDFEKRIFNDERKDDKIKRALSSGPYLNLFINRDYFIKEVIAYISKTNFEDLKKQGRGKTVIIDYSSPNIAKPFGIGHLRSTVIGNSLKKIFAFFGYNVIGINHLGDWGTQFGKLISAYRKWGDETRLKSDPIRYLYKLYVKFHREADHNPELEDEARNWFGRLENGDRDATKLWEKFRELSIDEFKKIYERLNVEFEFYAGESFYSNMLHRTVEEVKKSGITELSEGALAVPLEDMPPALIKKKDGSTLYLTRDIAAVLYRYGRFHFDLCLYVVGSPQSLHFKQMFKVLKKMKKPWVSNCYHVPFGQIRFEDRSMSTRKGNIIFLEEVMDKAVSLASGIIQEKNPHLQNKKEVAEAIGVGSIIFNDLKNYRIKDITFNWNEVLNFNGETGVYLQYTHARINSLLKKFTERYGEVKYKTNLSFPDEGYSIVVLINNFENTVLRAKEEFEPSIISKYLLELASEFNAFYNTHRVITENPKISLSRALLVLGVKKVLKQGLELLGIKAVEEM